MIPVLPRHERRRIQKLYAEMSDGVELCISGCYRCCVESPITYIEFAYLASGVGQEKLRGLVSHPRMLRTESQKVEEDVIEVKGKTALVAGGKSDENYYCPLLDSRKCASYKTRPWVCRDYRRYPEKDVCMWTIPMRQMTKNLRAAHEIKAENESSAPVQFRNVDKTIREWFEILSQHP